MNKTKLILEDGSTFEGISPKWVGETSGEVVFTTGMCGYPESLSDPSYTGQILTFTYPIIGNYGVPPIKFWESKKITVRGVVINQVCTNWSHHESDSSLLECLKKQNIPIIYDVDTRAITKKIRSFGTMLGGITTARSFKKSFYDPNKVHLVSQAANREIRSFNNGKKKVLALDCGMKENIIRSLINLPINLKVVPFDFDISKENYDGLFISNGPGDPTLCPEAVLNIKKSFKKEKPIFGICLGTQIMALGAGAKTYKLPFGHRGQNQPCIDLETNKCYITSQNHGFAIDPKTLPKDWIVTHINLNDNSIEGIAHKKKPFFAVQFHPEASPGPTDTKWLFNKFYEML